MGDRTIKVIDLGRMGYGEALELQRKALASRIAGETSDALYLVEHNPVLTLGTSSHSENILASREALKEIGIEVFEIERGGDVTYHGPGQQVGYPILNIKELGIGLHDYLRKIEETMIVALQSLGILGRRIEGMTGVFAGDDKVVAIGIAVKKWVTYHGFAFNVKPDMRHFELIVPCGIRDHGVTSLSKLLGIPVDLSDLRPHLLSAFADVFDIELVHQKKEAPEGASNSALPA